jgi:multidrug efflux pump subunit AcrA (membrane-fusion protein)
MELGRVFRTMLVLGWVTSFGAVSAAAVPKKANVLLLEAKAQVMADSLSYPGRVKSRVNAITTSEIEGQVVKIERPLGSKVKRGDVILVLQNTDPVYRYAPIRMRSPSAGYLTSLDVTLMTKVERGQKLFTITDPKDLLVEVEIPAHDLGSLRPGMRGEFKPDPLLPDVFSVEIEGLSPLVDVKSGTATAELRFLTKSETLRQGLLGQVALKTNERSSFIVPESAIIYRDDKPYVRILTGGKVQKKSIELGSRRGDSFEIKSGLQPGEQIVTRTSRFVSDGEEVEVQSQPEAK